MVSLRVPKTVCVRECLIGKTSSESTVCVKLPEPSRTWIPSFNSVLKEVLERGFESDPTKRITAGQAYELLVNAPQDPMQIELLTPPKK